MHTRTQPHTTTHSTTHTPTYQHTHVQLSDFGLMVQLEDAQQYVETGTYGSINHMAPEVISEMRVGYKGDVYSLGVLMWRMVTGSRPWAGLSNLQVTVAVGYEGQRLSFPESKQKSSLLFCLQDLALRCMSSNPDDRPTAEEASRELEKLRGLVWAQ